MFWVLRSSSIVRSQDWRGRPLRLRQSSGRRLMESWSACAWSCDGSARWIWSNGLRGRSRMVLVTRLCFIRLQTVRFETCAVGMRRMCCRQHWSKASRRHSPGCDSHRPRVSTIKQNWEDGNVIRAELEFGWKERWMSARYRGPGLSCRSGQAQCFYGCRCRTRRLGHWMNSGRPTRLTWSPRTDTELPGIYSDVSDPPTAKWEWGGGGILPMVV